MYINYIVCLYNFIIYQFIYYSNYIVPSAVKGKDPALNLCKNDGNVVKQGVKA